MTTVHAAASRALAYVDRHCGLTPRAGDTSGYAGSILDEQVRGPRPPALRVRTYGAVAWNDRHFPGRGFALVDAAVDGSTAVEVNRGTYPAERARSLVRDTHSVVLRRDCSIGFRLVSLGWSRSLLVDALAYARATRRTRVTLVHKANAMKHSDGLLLRAAEDVASDYAAAGVALDDRLVDNAAMQLVQRPEEHDVVVCPRAYGDVLGAISAGLLGSDALVPTSRWCGRSWAFGAQAPAGRASLRRRRGADAVTLVGALLGVAARRRHLGHEDAAARLELAVTAAARSATGRTSDVMAMAHRITETLRAPAAAPAPGWRA